MLATLLTLALPALLGTGLLRWLGIGPREDRVAFLGWSLLTGAFGTALLLAGWLLLGLPPAPVVAVPILAVAILAHLRARRSDAESRAAEAPVPVSQYSVMLSTMLSRVRLPTGSPATNAREIL